MVPFICYYYYLKIDDGGESVRLGCENDKSGVAFVVGAGADVRYRRWTLTPQVNAVYVGGKCDVSCVLSVGFFY